MSMLPQQDLTSVLEAIKSWPPPMRVSLARMILETVETPEPAPGPRQGLSATEVMDLMKTDKPAPDDETVRRWIDEHLVEKHGR